jgi:hypothetical protein
VDLASQSKGRDCQNGVRNMTHCKLFVGDLLWIQKHKRVESKMMEKETVSSNTRVAIQVQTK